MKLLTRDRVPPTWMVWTVESQEARNMGRSTNWAKCRRGGKADAGSPRNQRGAFLAAGTCVSPNARASPRKIDGSPRRAAARRAASPRPIVPRGPTAPINALRSLSRGSSKSAAAAATRRSVSRRSGTSASSPSGLRRSKPRRSAGSTAAIGSTSAVALFPKCAVTLSSPKSASPLRRAVNQMRAQLRRSKEEEERLAEARRATKQKEAVDAAKQRAAHLTMCAARLVCKRASGSASRSGTSSTVSSAAPSRNASVARTSRAPLPSSIISQAMIESAFEHLRARSASPVQNEHPAPPRSLPRDEVQPCVAIAHDETNGSIVAEVAVTATVPSTEVTRISTVPDEALSKRERVWDAAVVVEAVGASVVVGLARASPF